MVTMAKLVNARVCGTLFLSVQIRLVTPKIRINIISREDIKVEKAELSEKKMLEDMRRATENSKTWIVWKDPRAKKN